MGRTLSRRFSCVLLVLLGLWGFGDVCGGAQVTVEQLDAIRGKNVISDDRDVPMIQTFVSERFEAMKAANSEEGVSLPLSELLNGVSSTSAGERAKVKYGETFALAVEESYGGLLERAEQEKIESLSRQMKISAAMVVCETDHVRLIDDLAVLLKSESPSVRYWALKGLAKPEVANYLEQSNSESRYVGDVVAALGNVAATEASPMIRAEIVSAVAVLINQAGMPALVQTCMQERVARYRDWTVDTEYSDLLILQAVFRAVSRLENIESNALTRRQLVRGAAELFTVAYDRYGKGTMYVDAETSEPLMLLAVQSQSSLRMLLIEGEAGFLSLSGDARGGRFVAALQKNKPVEFSKAYDGLLGKNGVVTRTFGLFGGGENDIAELQAPPERVIERAKIMKEIKNKAIGGDMF